MGNSFTMYCISWQEAAPLLHEVRADACEIGLLTPAEVIPDETDLQSRHVLALNADGRGIGYARITLDGRFDRRVALPHEQQEKVEMALLETLNANTAIYRST